MVTDTLTQHGLFESIGVSPTSFDIKAGDLEVDHRYQRDVKPTRLKQLADALDLDAIGEITVSERKDASLVIIDGQHRVAALKERGLSDWPCSCRVYCGLTLRQEALLFRKLNNTKKPSIWDEFKAGLVAKEPEAVRINAIARSKNLTVARLPWDGKVACIATMRHIYRTMGEAALGDALGACIAAWGRTTGAVERYIVDGMALVLDAYRTSLEWPIFIEKLAKAGGGPGRILGRARSARDAHGGHVKVHVANVILATYNKGRRIGKLDAL